MPQPDESTFSKHLSRLEGRVMSLEETLGFSEHESVASRSDIDELSRAVLSMDKRLARLELHMREVLDRLGPEAPDRDGDHESMVQNESDADPDGDGAASFES